MEESARNNNYLKQKNYDKVQNHIEREVWRYAKGTTLTVETPLSSCDPDKIKAAIKAAGFNKQAQDAYSQAWWDIKKV